MHSLVCRRVRGLLGHKILTRGDAVGGATERQRSGEDVGRGGGGEGPAGEAVCEGDLCSLELHLVSGARSLGVPAILLHLATLHQREASARSTRCLLLQTSDGTWGAGM
jgi:hypothetical protein